MLDSMVQQARMVVFKAVAKATSATESFQTNDNSAAENSEASVPPSSSLAGFSSALNISISKPGRLHQPSHRLQKARSSALKLNSVLQGRTGHTGASGLDKSKKSRSVQWDQGVDLPKPKISGVPSPKRQRVAETSNRLRSFKSFGRPHAGDFGSGPRNATFGNFGRGPIWGRDGKLANHPSPMQVNDNATDLLSQSPTPGRNATFDFQRPSLHLSSGLSATGRSASGRMNKVPSTLPRTATALEGWLMEKTGGNS